MLCVVDATSIIVAVISLSGVLAGTWWSFKQWKSEKERQRIEERKELLTKLVGECLSDLDYVVLQYQKLSQGRNKNKHISQEKITKFHEKVEPYVKRVTEIINETELIINDDNILSQLKLIQTSFISIINKCVIDESHIDSDLAEYSIQKENLINLSKYYINSLENVK